MLKWKNECWCNYKGRNSFDLIKSEQPKTDKKQGSVKGQDNKEKEENIMLKKKLKDAYVNLHTS